MSFQSPAQQSNVTLSESKRNSVLAEFDQLKLTLLAQYWRVRDEGYKVAVNSQSESITIRHNAVGPQQCQLFVRGEEKDIYRMSVLSSVFTEIIGE